MSSLRSRAAYAVLAACLSQTGCGVVDPGGDLLGELERNEELWGSVVPASYQYGIERLCFCGAEARGPVLVTVANGQVADRRYVDSGDEVSAAWEDLFPTVDGLFDVLRDAIARDAHAIEVTYDRETGVPVDLWIDYSENTADEELGFRVSEPVASTPLY